MPNSPMSIATTAASESGKLIVGFIFRVAPQARILRTLAINGSRPLNEPSLRTLPASPLHRLVPCASSPNRTRSAALTRSASHAGAGGTLRHRRRWPPAGDGVPRGFQLPRDRRKGIQPASENSSGVTIRGGGKPSALSVSYSAGSKSAFAMCLQFQVSK